MIKAAETNLVKVTEKTIVIPGHGKIGGKSEMTEYRDMLTTIHDRVAALKLKSPGATNSQPLLGSVGP